MKSQRVSWPCQCQYQLLVVLVFLQFQVMIQQQALTHDTTELPNPWILINPLYRFIYLSLNLWHFFSFTLKWGCKTETMTSMLWLSLSPSWGKKTWLMFLSQMRLVSHLPHYFIITRRKPDWCYLPKIFCTWWLRQKL